MRESVIYQEIHQEGKQEGKQEEGLVLVLRLLGRRVGVLSPELKSQVEILPLPVLEDLGEALLDFSQPADLVAWLQAHQKS